MDVSISGTLAELRDVANKLRAFYTQMSTYLSTQTGTPPSFEEVSQTLKYDETLTSLGSLQQGSGSYGTGYLGQSLYEVASIQREASMASAFKTDLYVFESGNLLDQADYTDFETARRINYIQGNSPEQKISF